MSQHRLAFPTGWKVVLDLVEKLAHLKNENCIPDPKTWYKQKFEHEPRYDELLNDVAKTPAERRNLLRSYFEPTADEREQGKKVPQDAHRTIAELITRGYIRVIITTNFDRLLEKALEDQGIHPTVIATADAVKGALPLVQTACTLIKVNGDYLDPRIRNTPEELARYDRATNKLLDQVFDEFGLIICGWSAEWDVALCQAIRRCPTRRFSVYWTLKREPKPITRDLIEFRHAHSILITGADKFFRDLAEKVFSLENLAEQHPLSAKVAAEQVKRYIADDRHRILLHDFVGRETDTLHHRLSEDSFSWAIQLNEDGFMSRVKHYEALTESMIAVMAAGCYWGDQIHEGLWPRALERVAVPPFTWKGGDTSFPRLSSGTQLC